MNIDERSLKRSAFTRLQFDRPLDDKFDVSNLLIDEACRAVNGLCVCVQNIIVIAGSSNVGTIGFMQGVIEAKEWTRSSIGINLSVIMKASRDVSSASVAKQSMSEESRVKVSAAPFTSSSTKIGNSGITNEDCHMGSSLSMQCQTTS